MYFLRDMSKGQTTSRDKVHLRLVQYSDHADPMTLRVPTEGFPMTDPLPRAEIYRESIHSHNTWLNARRVDGRERRDMAHLKLEPASRRGARRVLHRRRDRSAGGRVYSEKGSARERAARRQQNGWQVLIGALHLARDGLIKRNMPTTR